ncbi:ABC-type amino acid transport substrate-binding protein [Inhella inkyongensis]|uniref:ABC-type amino acid transport substrate-binding protein n=1 Tax=Inhella inkyongensis TaxID=392593 RepID=A0A840RZQ8_9BURK|nr:transporter substrate-binding domain-containing protein [Inhella inkyongensis]MBB5204277.1 ABC-type amino acid transport substrate-binding protein [Inhella inkyongensis]
MTARHRLRLTTGLTGLIGLASLLAAPQAGAEEAALRVALSQSWGPPFAQVQESQVKGGFNVELALRLGQLLKRRVQFVPLPRARLDAGAVAGEYDLRCHASPDWVRQPEAYVWSAKLFVLPEVLVGQSQSPPLRRLQDLGSQDSVGAALHFSYPQLEALPNGWRRDDALSPDRALRKLALGRTRYAVATLFEVTAFEREAAAPGLSEWRLPIGHAPYHCAVPKAGKVAAADVLGALRRLVEQGEIEALMRAQNMATVALVVGPGSPWTQLSRAQMEALYLGRLSSLDEGGSPQLLSLGGDTLQAFASELMQRSAAQLRAEWSRAGFSGKGRRPQVLDSAAALKQRLRQQPLAIGYLPLDEVDADLRVLQ